jgi:Tfp pilus assembly protein PilO
MDIKIKALLAIAPFGIAVAVGTSLAMPAYNDYIAKSDQVDAKKTEQEQLQAKLSGKAKLQRDKAEIEKAVEGLRGSVPKKPELEILNMDLERMCDESGMDMVAFKEPDKEVLNKAGLDEQPENPREVAKNKIKAAARGAAAAAGTSGPDTGAGASPAAKAAAAKAAAAQPDAGLAKVIIQVKCIGDYNGMEQLVKKLETYQRVVAVTQLKATVPKREKVDKEKKAELPDDGAPTDQDEQGDWKRMNVSFLLTAYYLP